MVHKDKNNTKNANERGSPDGFRIHGTVQEKESGQGVVGLIVEAFDKDLNRDDRLGSATTDGAGRFELRYEKEDFQELFFDSKPDLYLRVKTEDGRVIHTTENQVRYGAGRTEAFIIKVPRSDLGTELIPAIKAITVSAQPAKAAGQIRVTAHGESGGRVRFSIARVFGASDVPMSEDSDEPGTYHGVYLVEVGDNVENAEVTVLFTTKSGKTIVREAEGTVTIDTIPPRISSVEVAPEAVSNGGTFQIKVKSESGCSLIANISEVDTTQKTAELKERLDEPGIYQADLAIHKENKATNGAKKIKIIARDAAGNEGEPTMATVTLRNSELHSIRGLESDEAGKLHNAGVVTLADLRRIDVEKVAHETGLSSEALNRYRTSNNTPGLGNRTERSGFGSYIPEW